MNVSGEPSAVLAIRSETRAGGRARMPMLEVRKVLRRLRDGQSPQTASAKATLALGASR